MTKKEMEMHIKSLEDNLSTLAKKVYDRDSSNEGKIDKVDTTVSEQSVTLEEHTELIGTNNSVTDMILTDIVTTLEDAHDDINGTIDMILTEVIPELLGSVDE